MKKNKTLNHEIAPILEDAEQSTFQRYEIIIKMAVPSVLTLIVFSG